MQEQYLENKEWYHKIPEVQDSVSKSRKSHEKSRNQICVRDNPHNKFKSGVQAYTTLKLCSR